MTTETPLKDHRMSVIKTTLAEYREFGGYTLFMGVPLTELDRDDLLGLIGYIGKDMERMRKDHQSERDFMGSIARRIAR